MPIDINHLERCLRSIAGGRKSRIFCWTEAGARHIGIVQSLIVNFRLHGVDPYTHLGDILQCVDRHPAAQLPPRLLKQGFADAPLRSDLHGAAP